MKGLKGKDTNVAKDLNRIGQILDDPIAKRSVAGLKTTDIALYRDKLTLNFIENQFVSGRRFRILNVVDDVTRECLAAIPDTAISGRRVARELTT